MTSSDGAVDFGACASWPTGFDAHLDGFGQGHIIGDLPVFFLESDVALWSRPRQQFGTSGNVGLVGEHQHPRRRVMLLTQACDLLKPKNPWITVCPVYDASGRLPTSQQGQIRSGQIGHLVAVTAAWANDGFWVADLRLEMPLEKLILMGRSPIDAFASEQEYSTLAARLGSRRQRPAAPQPCLDLVITPLFEAMHSLSDDGVGLNHGVRELRVSWNDHAAPTVVHVFVVANDETDREMIDVAGWEDLVLGLYQTASDAGMTIVGPEVTSLEIMPAIDYIQSALIEDTLSS